MGRRSRKRGSTDAVGPPRTPAAHRAPTSEAPEAPWSPFPLVELAVLIALVPIVVAFLTDGPRRGVLLACGVALASLAGLELAICEHVTEFRSHSALLTRAIAVVVIVSLFLLTGLSQLVLVAIAAGVYGLGFGALRRAFQARTGGLGFRA
jgi:hypothetical protein